MISSKTISVICLGASLCAAQTINVKGFVKNTAGVGISGAKVQLQNATVSAITNADGSFTLTNGPTKINQGLIRYKTHESPTLIQNGNFFVSVFKNTISGNSIYEINGKEMPAVKGSSLEIFPSERPSNLEGSSPLAKQSISAAVIMDEITATKTGLLNYRSIIRNSDTSGVLIIMKDNAGDVTDIDGNVYQSVKIGTQIWTAENLKTTKYNDGSPIPYITDNAQWSKMTTGAYCFYGNNTGNKVKFGAMYNWFTVNTGKLAPLGWHVPSDAEWQTLLNYLIANGYNYDGTKDTNAENKVAKSLCSQTTDWTSGSNVGACGSNIAKNNSTGFNGLPGGYRREDGSFSTMGIQGHFYCTLEVDATNAWDYHLHHDGSGDHYTAVHRDPKDTKPWAKSVRLIKD